MVPQLEQCRATIAEAPEGDKHFTRHFTRLTVYGHKFIVVFPARQGERE
jgi:hypothetical protein